MRLLTLAQRHSDDASVVLQRGSKTASSVGPDVPLCGVLHIGLRKLKETFQMFIDTPRQIAEALHFPLRCVDGLQGAGLRSVQVAILEQICYLSCRCVDLAAGTPTQ